MNSDEGVTQTLVVEQVEGVPGNCLQAALATLLRLPIEAVPHFLLFDRWRHALDEWLEQFDLEMATFGPNAEVKGRYLLVGPSPRGFKHTVVADRGEPIWDPHPSRDGLTSVDEVWVVRHIDGSVVS